MKQKQFKHLFRRKSIRRKKIGRYAEKKLMQRGFADMTNGVVFKDDEQKYFSPFIKQEISLCLVQIHAEKQTLAEIVAFYNSRISQKDIQVKKLLSRLNDIDAPIDPTDNEIALRYDGEESMMESVVQSLRINEYQQKFKTMQQQRADITANMKLLETGQKEDQIIVQTEMEITKYRCLQHYNLLIARLSAYWNGVLKAYQKAQHDDRDKIPPIFLTDDLFQDLHSEIDQLSQKRGIKYG